MGGQGHHKSQQKACPPETQLAAGMRQAAGAGKVRQPLQVGPEHQEEACVACSHSHLTATGPLPQPCSKVVKVDFCPQVQPSLMYGGPYVALSLINACCSMASAEDTCGSVARRPCPGTLCCVLLSHAALIPARHLTSLTIWHLP